MQDKLIIEKLVKELYYYRNNDLLKYQIKKIERGQTPL